MKRANFTESYASVLFQIYGFVSSSLSFSLEYFECVGDSGCSACLKFGCCVLAGAARLKVQISEEIVVYRLVISCEKNGFNLLKSELEAEHSPASGRKMHLLYDDLDMSRSRGARGISDVNRGALYIQSSTAHHLHSRFSSYSSNADWLLS